jgi:uncharacterized protein
MNIQSLILFLLFSFSLQSQEETVVLKTKTGDLEGSLLIVEGKETCPLVLIIAGSGPTDRNGNNSAMENNSLKLLAEELQKNNIASFRFDKRGVGQSSDVDKDESQMRPETFVNDVADWITLLSKDKRFNSIIIAGHSEGSLFGMLAAKNNSNVQGYISIAGAGRPIDIILKEQFEKVDPQAKKIIYSMLDQLKKGDTIANVPPLLYSVFRPSLQPYMTAWMKYNPQTEIKKLNIPILITTGSTDIQVKEIDAELLAKAQPKAQLKIIKNMNHVLKNCDTLDKEIQMGIYDNPELPLNKEFSLAVINFINEHFIPAKPVATPANKN